MAVETVVLIAIFLATAAYVSYRNFTKNHRKWTSMPGVPSLRPSFPFGNMGDLYMRRKSFMDGLLDVMGQLKGHRFGVAFDMSQPMFVIKDHELIKQICITDFWHFSSLGFFPPEVQEMECNDMGLASKVGEEWKNCHQIVSPAFSLKNLKDMATQVQECARTLMHNIEENMDGNAEMDIHKLIKSYTLDVIARITCSIKVDSYTNWDSEFVKIVDSQLNAITVNLSFMLPWVFAKLNISVLNAKFIKCIENLSTKILDQRRKDGTIEHYNDALAVMTKVKSGRKLEDLEVLEGSQIGGDIISKTIMQFYFDGYDTSKNLMLPLIFLLSLNPDAQEKAISEVDEIFLEHGEDLSGNDVKKLKYLDMVVQEATRLFPVLPPTRVCTKDWRIPDSDVVIPRGMKVIISMENAKDPTYFENPEKFYPDRWSRNEKQNIPSGLVLTFGLGPRICTGQGIFYMEAKILLYNLLHKYRIKPGPTLSYPIRRTIDGFGVEEDQSVILEKREH